MDLATGAMNTLLPKLAELVVGQYKLQKVVKGEIKELEEELTSMTAALRKVAEVPPDQLDEQVKIWAGDVRELSYDIEDEVDTFMLRNKEHDHSKPFSLKGLFGKAKDLCKKAKTNHKIHNVVKDIMDQVKKVAERRDRCKVDNIAVGPVMVTIDPRLEGMYRKATELVGIGQPKKELAMRLLKHGCSSSSLRKQSNIISIVGFGGLGKTTLANSLLQDLKVEFDCRLFVSVSLNPDIMKILKNILLQLDEKKYSHLDEGWEVNQLIDKIKEFLENKKCLCVIDDIWKESAWDAIKLAFQDGHPGSKIIITTRNKNVAEYVCGGVYELKPLSDGDSRKLFNMRIYGTDDECPASLGEVTRKIIKKCGGVPLAIITIASLLYSKPKCSVEWEKVNESIGFGLGDSFDVDKMRKILSLSYNDLPFHLKTCLLSLSKYPEDQKIRKDALIWSWVAEGFITEETEPAGKSLQEKGENYFSELINRSLIQPVEERVIRKRDGQVHSCQVHDMVLELINQLSAKESFVTTLLLDDQQVSISIPAMQQQKIRRLSLHNSNKSYDSPDKAIIEKLSKVRSLDIFGKVKSIPPLSSFHVLRVLQVDDCSGLSDKHANDLGKLRLLRFLRLHGLKGSGILQSIGKLESLETLDIRGSVISLPLSFGKLGKLVRLMAWTVILPDGMSLENMTSLQELVGIMPTSHAVTEIGNLRQLRVLGFSIFLGNFSIKNELILKCLRMCPSIQILFIKAPEGDYSLDFMEHVPFSLQRFVSDGLFMGTFPRWINPSLSCLTHVTIGLELVNVLPMHLDDLAGLPSLRFLGLYALNCSGNQELLFCPSGASAFQCLTELQFECYLMFLRFEHGSMRKLQKLQLSFNALSTAHHFRTAFDYGLENLPSLRHVAVQLIRDVCFEAENAIMRAINGHPNHPSLQMWTAGDVD